MSTDHRVALGTTGWSVWRSALLRTTGFPADGLDLFAGPEAAIAADEWLRGEGSQEQFAKAYDEAAGSGAANAVRIAGDPLFREAITWQNPGMLAALDGLIRGWPPPRRDESRRYREKMLARYWQRYCAKNETIGYFGPICWVSVDPDRPEALRTTPGPDLIRRRWVALEYWALAAFGDTVAADPQARRWLRPVRQPHLSSRGDGVRRPAAPDLALPAAQAAAFRACDGRRTAIEVAELLLADPALGVRRESDAYLLLEWLVEHGLVRWDANLPMDTTAEQALRARLTAIGDEEVRARHLHGLDRLGAARDAVAAAAGDPAALRARLADLDAEFTALTGREPSQRPGQTYAGRALCYIDASRDLDVVVGAPILQSLAEPLALLLRAARWLCARLGQAYLAALRELYDDLARDLDEVTLADLWYLAQGPLFGAAHRPVDAVTEEFSRRWAELFGLDTLGPGTRALQLRAADLVERTARTFPNLGPGWSAGRLHSPDLQLCAASEQAIRDGDFLVVLGELHAGWPTFDTAGFTVAHPDLPRLIAGLEADLGQRRIRPLYPTTWPRWTARIAHSLIGPTDRELGFDAAPGADPDHLLPATAVTVSEQDGTLVARDRNGTTWPLLEMFSALLSMQAVDGFKLLAPADHSPRITVDRLVVARETWRTTVAGTGIITSRHEQPTYLAARRWRATLGLPEHVFARIATELKPCYVDFTSPHYVHSFATMLRSAREAAGGDVPVVVSEMLPDAGQAWVSDAAGRRYFSELRIQVTDAEAVDD